MRKAILATMTLAILAATPLLARTDIGSGIASYYGNEFNGRRTASGEIFRNSQMTAAHKTLRFGTQVRVTNVSNGKAVVVRINDRGPWTKGRVIDLSQAAAKQIGLHRSGTARVKLQLAN